MLNLVIKGSKGTLTFDVEPEESKSGKMTLLATSHGNAGTDAKYDGKQVFVNVNIGVFNKPKSNDKGGATEKSE